MPRNFALGRLAALGILLASSHVPASAQTVNTLVHPGDRHRKPWRFGNTHERDHGYSDHFPITLRLKVEGN